MKDGSLNRAEVNRIWESVKANQDRLNKCVTPHDFQPLPEAGTKRVRRHRCTLCGGTTDVVDAHWYKLGLEHGQRK